MAGGVPRQVYSAKTNPPALGFFLGGASSSDEESSLADSAAAAGFAGAGLTGAYQNKHSFFLNLPLKLQFQLSNCELKWCCEIVKYTLGGSSSSESDELSSLLLSCFFWAATLLRPSDLVVGVGAVPGLASMIKGHVELWNFTFHPYLHTADKAVEICMCKLRQSSVASPLSRS